MPIIRTSPYPVFDPANPNNVMAIPDNITETFGTYTFSFRQTRKLAWLTSNGKTKIYNGDYGIFINNLMVTDPQMAALINDCTDNNLNTFLKQNINLIAAHNFEIDAFNAINSLTIPQNISNHTDLIKTFFYYSWHRCQIEDRAYPSAVGLLGRQMYFDFVNEHIE